MFWGITIGSCSSFVLLAGPKAYRLAPTLAFGSGLVVTAIVSALVMATQGPAKSSTSGAVLEKTRQRTGSPSSLSSGSSRDQEREPMVPRQPPKAKRPEPDVEANVTFVENDFKAQELHAAEVVFSPLMVITACVVSFAHGSNDVSNCIGPFAAVVQAVLHGNIDFAAGVPLWILLSGGAGIGMCAPPPSYSTACLLQS